MQELNLWISTLKKNAFEKEKKVSKTKHLTELDSMNKEEKEHLSNVKKFEDEAIVNLNAVESMKVEIKKLRKKISN